MPIRCKEMSAITQCPQCGTSFKVSQEQMETHLGMVRCGRCHEVFNAIKHLHDDEPSPQLSLPISAEEENQEELAPTATAAINDQTELIVEAPASPIDQTQEFSVTQNDDNNHELPVEPPAKKERRWPQAIAASLLLLILLAQPVYFFRVELAAHLPGLKPALVSTCNLLKCSIPLPQKIEQLSIESSEIEANPAQANIISLNLILRNSAPYAQTYPHLELTLTDTSDQALARRTFVPKDYLELNVDEKQGLGSRREANIKLHLDTTDLKASGYRLLLFYPG